MKKTILERIKRMMGKRPFRPPSHLLNNQIQIDQAKLQTIEKSIRENYHTGWRSESNYSKEAYANDLNNHLNQRLQSDRKIIIPWLDNASPLRGKRILEIGCGTGSSTVAIAEQGAKVTGIDIDEGALSVAQERAQAYGVDIKCKMLNANDMLDTFGTNAFDMIIFFACLEHMTISERLISLKNAWQMLPAGGLIAIVETPNRLWYFDGHTSNLPFFHWLPHELAFQYSKFSSRENFRELYQAYNPASKEHFLRRGRGMSFHELEIAIAPAKELKVISSLSTFNRGKYKSNQTELKRKYKSLLMDIHPHIHEGFFDETLYLIIEKRGLGAGD